MQVNSYYFGWYLVFKVFLKSKLINNTESQAKDRNRRFFDRFDVKDQHLLAINDSELLQIQDISAKGFSCKVADKSIERFLIGDQHAARIKYLDETHDLNIKVAWKEKSLVGFELFHADEDTLRLFMRLIKPMAMARSLQKVDAAFINDGDEDKTWYHGDDGTDFILWRNGNKQIVSWQLVFNGHYIDWTVAKGFSTGLIVKEPISSIALSFPTDECRKADKTVDEQTIGKGIDVLAAASSQDSRDALATIQGKSWASELENDD